ncbi:MAG: hypothetical protein UC961_09840, partial [Emergencia sp.]|nr:hypothetical protein [Emergencia sp.]
NIVYKTHGRFIDSTMSFSFFDKNKIMALAAIVFCLIMVAFPEITATAAKEAVSLWLNSVVPMLFPFFVGANFLKHTGIVKRLSPRIYPFAMGALSGYPMGACMAGEYYRKGIIDRQQLQHILSYSMITGPAFLIGTVGYEFLGSHRLGLILAAGHYIGAYVHGLFFGKAYAAARQMPPGKRGEERKQSGAESGFGALTDAILESFRSIGIILAYIILFMIAADLLQFSGALRFAPTAEAAAVLKGMFEMTVGCSSLAACQCSQTVKTVLAAFIVTFGGLSVTGQSVSMLRNCGVKFGELFVMKLSHGILSAIITFSICSFVV